MPIAAASEEGSHDRAEGRADEKRGHDLAALESCGDGDGSEQDLDQESVDRDALAVQAFRDHVTARAVVELAAGEQGHCEQDQRHDRSAGDRLQRDLSCERGDPAQRDDEEHADQRAQDGEDERGDGEGERKGRYA